MSPRAKHLGLIGPFEVTWPKYSTLIGQYRSRDPCICPRANSWLADNGLCLLMNLTLLLEILINKKLKSLKLAMTWTYDGDGIFRDEEPTIHVPLVYHFAKLQLNSQLHLHSISTLSQFNSSKSWVGVMPYIRFAPYRLQLPAYRLQPHPPYYFS